MTTYRINEEFNGIEITFESKPAEDIRSTLKENGSAWSWPRSSQQETKQRRPRRPKRRTSSASRSATCSAPHGATNRRTTTSSRWWSWSDQ